MQETLGRVLGSFIELILRRRVPMLIGILLSLGLAVYSARTLRVQFRFADLYTYPENKALPLYIQDNEEFGDPAGYVVAMLSAPDVFQPDVLRYVQKLSAALAPDPHWKRVVSLTNTHAIRAQGDEVISGALIPEVPDAGNKAAFEALRAFAVQSPLLRRRLISADAKATAILAQMRVPAVLSTVEEQASALDAMKKTLAENPPPAGVQVSVTGAPQVEVETTRALISDQLVLTPAAIGLLIVMLYLTFRTFHGVLLALAAVTTATVWTAGVFALFGRPADMISSVVPTTILVYGVVDPVFVLTRVLHKLEGGREKNRAIVEAFSELALPCLLTSLTTALGFAAFATAAVPAVRYFGIVVAIGVLLSWLTTYTVLPVLLALTPTPSQHLAGSSLGRVIDRALHKTWAGLRAGGSTPVVVGALLLCGFGAAYAAGQTISNSYVGSLPRGAAQADVRKLEQQLMGVVRLVVHFEGEPGAMKRPEVLRAIEQIDREMTGAPLVTLSLSLADVLAEANQAFNLGDVAERNVPSSPTLIGQYLSLIDPVDRAELVSEDYARSRIAILLEDHGGAPIRELARNLQSAIDRSGLSALGVHAELTGNAIVAFEELDRVVVELLIGFVIATALIVLLQALFFRSLRLALISLVPNLLPMIACFVTTRLLQIDLRIDTCLVVCISVGGLFNTTIHYSARVLQQLAAGERDPDEILLHAMRSVGPPSLFTAVILSTGFAVFMLSKFYGLQALGLLSMITLLCGFASDMVVTTAFMRLAFDWRSALQRTDPAAEPQIPTYISQSH